MKHIRVILAVLFCAVALAAPPAVVHAQTIIINAANETKTLSKDEVSHFFLKKATKWENGKTVVPVDQGKSSKTRSLFSKTYHGRSTSAIESYWEQQIFSGKDVPPETKDDDEAVMAFVKANPNAIGYVTAGQKLDDGVKAVTITGLK